MRDGDDTGKRLPIHDLDEEIVKALAGKERARLVLSAPTASGKSSVGLELAELLGAEIVSLDSMAVYRGMNLGTAKPSATDLARVPHHLIDIVGPNEEFSLSQYTAAFARGRICVCVAAAAENCRS